MARFWTSDTHFGHEGILRFEPDNRPFSSVEEMNEVLVERWNAVVSPKDMVYHLGDVAMGKIAESLPVMGRLNGRKVLIPGNHDRVFSGMKQAQRDKFRQPYQEVFDAISREQERTHIGPHLVAMCHFPYEGDSHGEGNDRYSELRPVDEGLPLIHGHVHGQWKIRGRQFNVGVDVNSLQPVHEDEICHWLETLV